MEIQENQERIENLSVKRALDTIYGFDSELDAMFAKVYSRIEGEKYEYVKRSEELKSKSTHIFLTINPNTELTTPEGFFLGMTKMMRKPWIQKCLWCIEQRGETLDEMGKGYHFHAIIQKPSNKSYDHMVRELKSSANRYCDTSKSSFFNVHYISDEEKVRKIPYVSGRKADPTKWAKQEMDIPFRIKYGILSYYNIGIKEDAPETSL